MEQDRLSRAMVDLAVNLPLLAGCCAPIEGIAEGLILLAEATNEMVAHVAGPPAAADGRGPVAFPGTDADEA